MKQDKSTMYHELKYKGGTSACLCISVFFCVWACVRALVSPTMCFFKHTLSSECESRERETESGDQMRLIQAMCLA